MRTGMHMKDSVMDVVVTSALQKSCLLLTSKSSDHAVRKVENEKFRRDSNSVGPIQSSSTKRFIPLAMTHLGMRGGHFNSVLKEFATILVTRPSGCPLMRGPFALSMNGALGKIMHTWGSLLTWTAQRQHAAQILGGMDSFFASSSFLHSLDQDFSTGRPSPSPPPPPPLSPAAMLQLQPPVAPLHGRGHWPPLHADWHRNLVFDQVTLVPPLSSAPVSFGVRGRVDGHGVGVMPG